MLIYNIKTQVEFDLGYFPLIFDRVMAFYKNIAHLAGASVFYGHISSFLKELPLISVLQLCQYRQQ